VRIGERSNLLFPFVFLAGPAFLLGNDGVQSPGSEIHLQFSPVLSKPAIGDYRVSPKRISESLGRVLRRDAFLPGLCSRVGSIISRKFYAEVVDAFSPLWRKWWDATQVSKDGALVS
jgi:hypothetical protein